MESDKSKQNMNLDEQMKNMSPEAWANMKKSMMQGEIHAIKTGPWYYKLFIALFILVFVGFFVFIVYRFFTLNQEFEGFNENFEQHNSLTK